MELLISFYDNSLIYYPNVFFPAIFLIGILGLILLAKGIIWLIKSILELNKKIVVTKSSFNLYIRRNFKFIVLTTIGLFILMNKALTYFQFRIEKIIKKMKKEIFIEE